MYARDFRALARQALSGKWALAVLTGLVAAILGGTIGSGEAGDTVSSRANDVVQDYGWRWDIPEFVYTILFILASLFTVYVIVCLIFGGAVKLGYAKFNLALVDHKEAKIQDLFSQFDRFGSGFLLNLLTFVFVLLWTLLLIIPGIIAAFSYSMAPYILYENPGMRPYDALRASKELMKGNKWRLFCLGFSFIGWSLLASLPLMGFAFALSNSMLSGYSLSVFALSSGAWVGLFAACMLLFMFAILCVSVYQNASVTAFYLDVSGQRHRIDGTAEPAQ